MSRVIIAGSRTIEDYGTVEMVVELCRRFKGFTITEVVCGGAQGVDLLGKEWADNNQIPVKWFEADWDNIHAPWAVVKPKPSGKGFYNARAGHDRNQKMAEYADACIVIEDVGGSRGAQDMAKRAAKQGLKLEHVQLTEE